MKVVYHEDYNEVYSNDPASEAGRIQAVEIALRGKVTFLKPVTGFTRRYSQSTYSRSYKIGRAGGSIRNCGACRRRRDQSGANRFNRTLFCANPSPRSSCFGGQCLGILLF